MATSDIKFERERRGLTQMALATLTGIPRGRINAWENRGSMPKADDYLVLKKVFTQTPILSEDSLKQNMTFSEPDETYLSKRRFQKNVDIELRVPLVSVKARAGYVSSYDSVDLINSLDKYAIPPGVTYTGAIWQYFEVDGDSMDPVLTTGDYVLCSQVPNEDWTNNIRNYYIYVLVTNTEILIKRIFVKPNGKWVLISDNEENFKQQYFDPATLKELWIFRRLIKKSLKIDKTFKINI